MERIEVRYKRFTGSNSYHKYLVYHPESGPPQYARGGNSFPAMSNPPFLGNIETEHGEYKEGTKDWDTEGDDPREVLKEGGDLSSEWQKITKNMDDIEKMGIPYGTRGPNSNSAVDWALKDTGVPLPQLDDPGEYESPGSDIPIEKYSIGFDISDTGVLFDISRETVSPLVFDLDDDGFDLVSQDNSVAFFDLDRDGFAEKVGWVSPDDCLLALDRNGNGIVDDQGELFGDGSGYSDGFAALGAFDGNQDGVIDGADAVYSDLTIWRDLDGDGYSEANELMSLADAGIASIGLANTTTQQIIEGNEVRLTGIFTRIDGSVGRTADVWLAKDDVMTVAVNPLAGWTWDDQAVTEMYALPILRGYGIVNDLPTAMLLDASLRGLVQQFVSIECTETVIT